MAQHYEIKDFLQMDYATKASLDLTENARSGKKHGSLYWLMDETKTAMGGRMLRSWIQRPLIDEARKIGRAFLPERVFSVKSRLALVA